jgi:hypothetical protein
MPSCGGEGSMSLATQTYACVASVATTIRDLTHAISGFLQSRQTRTVTVTRTPSVTADRYCT